MRYWFDNPITMTAGFFSGFVTAFFVMRIVEQFLPVRKKRWAMPALYLGCFVLVDMAIFVGDPINLPGAFLGFGCTVFLCCKGSLLQRLSMTLILSSIRFTSFIMRLFQFRSYKYKGQNRYNHIIPVGFMFFYILIKKVLINKAAFGICPKAALSNSDKSMRIRL